MRVILAPVELLSDHTENESARAFKISRLQSQQTPCQTQKNHFQLTQFKIAIEDNCPELIGHLLPMRKLDSGKEFPSLPVFSLPLKFRQIHSVVKEL